MSKCPLKSQAVKLIERLLDVLCSLMMIFDLLWAQKGSKGLSLFNYISYCLVVACFCPQKNNFMANCTTTM